jgi:hypothetical protein
MPRQNTYLLVALGTCFLLLVTTNSWKRPPVHSGIVWRSLSSSGTSTAEAEPEGQSETRPTPEAENEPEPESDQTTATTQQPEPEATPENPPLSHLSGTPAWSLHSTLWRVLFLLLAVTSTLLLLYFCSSHDTQFRSSSLNTVQLSLVAVLSITRAVVFSTDPYNLQDLEHPYFPIIVYGMAFPCINGLVLAMTFASKNLLHAILHLERLQHDMLWKRRTTFVGIVFVQFLFQFVSDVVLSTSRNPATSSTPGLLQTVPPLLISCHLFFDIYGIALGLMLAQQIQDLSRAMMTMTTMTTMTKSKASKAGVLKNCQKSAHVLRPLVVVCILHFAYLICSLLYVIFYATSGLGDVNRFLSFHNVQRTLEMMTGICHIVAVWNATMRQRRRKKRVAKEKSILLRQQRFNNRGDNRGDNSSKRVAGMHTELLIDHSHSQPAGKSKDSRKGKTNRKRIWQWWRWRWKRKRKRKQKRRT